MTCNWIVLGACALVACAALDPVGSLRRPDGTTSSLSSNSKDVTTRSWTARFRWLFCCLTGDKNSQEAFRQVASQYFLSSRMYRNSAKRTSDQIIRRGPGGFPRDRKHFGESRICREKLWLFACTWHAYVWLAARSNTLFRGLWETLQYRTRKCCRSGKNRLGGSRYLARFKSFGPTSRRKVEFNVNLLYVSHRSRLLIFFFEFSRSNFLKF